MKNRHVKFFALLLSTSAIIISCDTKDKQVETPKQEETKPLETKKHSQAFNTSVDNMVTAYLQLKNSLVDADPADVSSKAADFILSVDSLNLKELEKDDKNVMLTALQAATDAKLNAQSLIAQKDITEMRRDFSMITQSLYPGFFIATNYEGKKLYVQECPMAFNDTEPASWLSDNSEIINPYLGNKHPKYKAGMLHCGELKDSIFAKP